MAWWSTPGWVVYAPSTADMGTILKTIGSRLCGVVIFEHSVKGAIRMLVELSSSKSLTCLISVHVLRCEESEMEGRASNHVMDMIINCRLEVVPPPDLPFEKMDERKVLVVAKVPLLRELLLRMGRHRRPGDDGKVFIAEVRPGGRPGPYPSRPKILRPAKWPDS